MAWDLSLLGLSKPQKNGRPSSGGRRCYFRFFIVSSKAVAAMSKATIHLSVLLIGVSLRVRLPSLSISTLRSAPTTATVSCSFVSTATESFTKEDLSVRWWTLSRSLTMRRSVTTLRRSVSPVSFTSRVSRSLLPYRVAYRHPYHLPQGVRHDLSPLASGLRRRLAAHAASRQAQDTEPDEDSGQSSVSHCVAGRLPTVAL